jgi:hypothetical protein
MHASFWLVPPEEQPPPRQFADLLGALGDLPVYRLTWNPGRHAAADALAAVRAAVRADRAVAGVAR